MEPQIHIGQFVTYVSTKGFQKPALVLGTPESIQQGHDGVPQLAEGYLHLHVFSPTGNHYTRQSVPSQALLEEQHTDGEVPAYWRV